MATLEYEIALFLRRNGHNVLGSHHPGVEIPQDQLGEINFCDVEGIEGTEATQVKMQGEKVESEPIDVVVESSKAVGEIYSPISGKVIAINRNVMGAPKKINEDPYGAGWLFQLEASNADEEKSKILSAADYAKFISK